MATKQLPVEQLAIAANLVTVGLAIADVRHIQQASVGITDNAVWLHHRIVDADQIGSVSIRFVDGLLALWRFLVIPPRPLVVGVGKVDRAVSIDPYIIRTIELGPLEFLEQNLVLP